MESMKTKKNIEDILSVLRSGQGNTNVNKVPNSFLEFDYTGMKSVLGVCVGYDNKVYSIDSDTRRVEKRETLFDEDPLEKGYIWDIDELGVPIHLIYTRKGLIVVANSGEGDGRREHIYRLPTINEEPIEIYSTPKGDVSFAGRNFGVDSYYTGIDTWILVGIYGRGPVDRDLLLSVDSGETFKVIKKTRNMDPDKTRNSHWHDVAFDVYNGLIWATQGDHEHNRAIYFSDDMGETFNFLTDGTEQPTAILPFADRVSFARDTGFAGIMSFEKPRITSDYKQWLGNLDTLYHFNPNIIAQRYYGESPVVRGVEGYFTFNRSDTDVPLSIMATGDSGKSYHRVYMGAYRRPFYIDDEYIYAYRQVGDSHDIMYSKKIDWV